MHCCNCFLMFSSREHEFNNFKWLCSLGSEHSLLYYRYMYINICCSVKYLVNTTVAYTKLYNNDGFYSLIIMIFIQDPFILIQFVSWWFLDYVVLRTNFFCFSTLILCSWQYFCVHCLSHIRYHCLARHIHFHWWLPLFLWLFLMHSKQP